MLCREGRGKERLASRELKWATKPDRAGVRSRSCSGLIRPCLWIHYAFETTVVMVTDRLLASSMPYEAADCLSADTDKTRRTS